MTIWWVGTCEKTKTSFLNINNASAAIHNQVVRVKYWMRTDAATHTSKISILLIPTRKETNIRIMAKQNCMRNALFSLLRSLLEKVHERWKKGRKVSSYVWL